MWEAGISLCKHMIVQFETETFDYIQLSAVLVSRVITFIYFSALYILPNVHDLSTISKTDESFILEFFFPTTYMISIADTKLKLINLFCRNIFTSFHSYCNYNYVIRSDISLKFSYYSDKIFPGYYLYCNKHSNCSSGFSGFGICGAAL